LFVYLRIRISHIPRYVQTCDMNCGSAFEPVYLREATDSYLSGVLQSVMDSDENLFRDFFLDVRETLCYQRVEDARPRVCVPAVCREAVLRAAHGDCKLAGHPGVDRTTAAVSHAFYWPGSHADVAHFVRTCKTCAASKSSNHQRLVTERLMQLPLYNHSQAGP